MTTENKFHFSPQPMRLFDDELYWTQVIDGNDFGADIFKRHYTFKPRKNWNGRFTGPGERIVLLTKTQDALFVWRKEKFRSDDQTGVNCAVFRNESTILSSLLILEAEQVAWKKWPGARLFTFVNATKIKSSNPGYCFKKAGWKQCGISTTRKLIILAKHA